MSEFTLLGKEPFRTPPVHTGQGKPVKHFVWIKGDSVADGVIPLWYYIDIPTERVVTTKRGMA